MEKKEEQNFELIKYKLEILEKGIQRLQDFIDNEAIRRKDFEKLQEHVSLKASRSEVQQLREEVKAKVDKVEFRPFRDALTKINWVIISAVIAGVLALVINIRS